MALVSWERILRRDALGFRGGTVRHQRFPFFGDKILMVRFHKILFDEKIRFFHCLSSISFKPGTSTCFQPN